MTDIAKLTGVSQSTVSLVLNNATSAKFSDATRNKVLKAAQDLGYRMTAREPLDAAIAANEKNLIVYLADEISTSPHPVVNIDGARDTAFANGRMLAVYSTHGNAEIEQQVLDATLTNPNVLGVIYATVYTRKVTLAGGAFKGPDGAAELLHKRFRAFVGGAGGSYGRPYRDGISAERGASKNWVCERRTLAGRGARPAEGLSDGALNG